MSNVIAIIGRPNVGKSTLFNRIVGQRISITHQIRGVTRDRIYGEACWNGKKFLLIDTGGFVPNDENVFSQHINRQVKLALIESNVIFFVVNAAEGLHPYDKEIANELRSKAIGKIIFVIANKVDNEKFELFTNDFFSLGFENIFPVSALSGKGVADLLDSLDRFLEPTPATKEYQDVKFAIIGKPNVGKSSIVNALLQDERNIVTDIPGTTRDAVDSTLRFNKQLITLIDTAGITKKSRYKTTDALEYYSTVRTYRAIERCDVAILVLDTKYLLEEVSGGTPRFFHIDRQNLNIIEDVVEAKKGLLIVFNKWDSIEKDSKTLPKIESSIHQQLKGFGFLKYIYISALTKQRIHLVLEEAYKIYLERKKMIKTKELNEHLLPEIKKKPLHSVQGKEIKISYITQLRADYPVFLFFTNAKSPISENYKRYLEKKIRNLYGFKGVPITIRFKNKD